MMDWKRMKIKVPIVNNFEFKFSLLYLRTETYVCPVPGGLILSIEIV